MRLKLLITFLVFFIIIFVFRAYGDHTSGGFPAFGIIHFLYWTFLYSLIPLLPAFFIFQIVSSSTRQVGQKVKTETFTPREVLIIVSKMIITFLAIILGVFIGFWVGLLFKPGDAGDWGFGGAVYGAPLGAVFGLLVCWFIFTKRS